MLVLSRQRDESIVIGDNVVVTIVDIRGDKVRLGIQAPAKYRSIARKSTKRSNGKTAKGFRCSPAGHRPKYWKPKLAVSNVSLWEATAVAW